VFCFYLSHIKTLAMGKYVVPRVFHRGRRKPHATRWSEAR